ncbi:hypothetical protein O181_073346, partial [Austropuccinia psidii MF-1]|nr:hypothetical protein [Austropuccinia psidii MF-1]
TLASKGTNQRTEKACPEPEDLEEDTLDTVVDEDLSQKDRLQIPYDNHERLELHQAVQTPGGEGKQDKGESSHYPSYRKTTDSDRADSDYFRLTRRRPNQLASGFPQFRNQREKERTQRKKQDLFQKKAERVRPNAPETVVLGEGSTQEPEVVVNHSRINSPLNRNVTPTQIEHNTVSRESNLKIDALWLQMSHERMKALTVSFDKIVKNLQERHAQLSKASAETNRRLNLVF